MLSLRSFISGALTLAFMMAVVAPLLAVAS